jgi:hypothetical protein
MVHGDSGVDQLVGCRYQGTRSKCATGDVAAAEWGLKEWESRCVSRASYEAVWAEWEAGNRLAVVLATAVEGRWLCDGFQRSIWYLS